MSNQTACHNMITQQLRTNNVVSSAILDLYTRFPRDAFVPENYKPFAYSDMQIPLAHQQRMMTPLEEALIIKALSLEGHETVLEVGTGTGFLTALLSQFSKKVISVDFYPEFTAQARQKLTEHRCENVTLHTGDASRGWIDEAPYDVVIYTSAMDTLTETHRLQVLPGGKLFAIIGQAPIMQGQLHELDHNGNWKSRLIFETNLPPLIDKLNAQAFVF